MLVDRYPTCPNPRGIIGLCPGPRLGPLVTLGRDNPGNLRIISLPDAQSLASFDSPSGHGLRAAQRAADSRELKAHSSEIVAMAISRDGSVLVTASLKGRYVRLFDTRNHEQIWQHDRGWLASQVESVAISLTGARLCISSSSKIEVFDRR